MSEQKKTPREIAESIFTVVNDWHESSGENTQEMCIDKIEQAIQAERHRATLIEADRDFLMQERDKLREENAKLTEANKWLLNCRDTMGRLQTENSRMLAVVNAARDVMDSGYRDTWPMLCDAIKELDQTQPETTAASVFNQANDTFTVTRDGYYSVGGEPARFYKANTVLSLKGKRLR